MELLIANGYDMIKVNLVTSTKFIRPFLSSSRSVLACLPFRAHFQISYRMNSHSFNIVGGRLQTDLLFIERFLFSFWPRYNFWSVGRLVVPVVELLEHGQHQTVPCSMCSHWLLASACFLCLLVACSVWHVFVC